MIQMVAASQAHSSEQPAEQRKKAGKISLYPLLGIVLALLTALLCYGSLLLLLLDDWSFLVPGAEAGQRR